MHHATGSNALQPIENRVSLKHNTVSRLAYWLMRLIALANVQWQPGNQGNLKTHC